MNAANPESTADDSARDPVESAEGDATDAAAPPVEEQLRTAMAERDQYLDQLTRTRAELDNYRKRAQREMGETRQYQSLSLVRDLLPGLDNLDRAVRAGTSSKNLDELLHGLQMVLKQFETILANHAARPIESVGTPFDPNLHEAIQQLPSAEHPPMTVLAELERGYTLHDRVVRPSKVIVSSGPPATE